MYYIYVHKCVHICYIYMYNQTEPNAANDRCNMTVLTEGDQEVDFPSIYQRFSHS